MNAREATQVIDIVRVGWPTRTTGAEFDPQSATFEVTVAVWAAAMCDLGLDEARAAVLDMLRQGRPHPPGVSEVVAAVFALRDEANGTKAPDLDQAVDEIMRRVAKRGYSKGAPTNWSHPALGEVVRAIGWRELCYSENVGVLRAHVMRLYEAARERHVTEARRAPQYRAEIEAKRSPELAAPVESRALPSTTTERTRS